jgi:hypothetical protein
MPISSYALKVLLVGSVMASMNGQGHIYPKYNGVYVGCLDENMRWVVNGDCGVFTANTLAGFSG